MGLAQLVRTVGTDPAIADAIETARAGTGGVLDLSAPAGLRPFVAALLAADPATGGAGRTVLLVTAADHEASALETVLTELLPVGSVAAFPPWETLPHERLSPRSDTVGRRLSVLRRLAHPDPDTPAGGALQVVVAPVRALLQPLVAGLGDLEPVTLRVGDEIELDDLVERLVAAAYVRVDMVERRGEVAVRGGIVDVFPPTEDHPLRIELWGDTVEEIRSFAVIDQRSLGPAPDGVWAPPCRELILTEQVRERARSLAAAHPELADMLDQLAEGIAVEGMEALAPVLVDGMELLVDVVPPGTVVLVSDPERVRSRAADLFATSHEFLGASWAAAAGGGVAPVDLGAAAYRTLGDVRDAALAAGCAWWGISPFAVDQELGGFEEQPLVEVRAERASKPAAQSGGFEARPSGLAPQPPQPGGLAPQPPQPLVEVRAERASKPAEAESGGFEARPSGLAPQPPQLGGLAPQPPQPGGLAPQPPQPGGLAPQPPQPGGLAPQPPQPGGLAPQPPQPLVEVRAERASKPSAITEPPAYRGDTDRAVADITGWLRSGWRVVLVTEGHGPAQRLVEVLRGADVPARFVEQVTAVAPPGSVEVSTACLTNGFLAPGLELVVLAEADLLGRAGAGTREERKMPSRRRNVVDPLQLRVGDYVVHEQHGVGAYVEMVQRTVQGATREYLVIEYASSRRNQPRDRLYVPTDSLDQVTRYVGGELPTLHKLGGADWARAKGRARKAVRQIAAELIKLYSARMAAPGFAFSPDTPWQRELEDAFPYVETPDQLETIDEVKADMERSAPMDRLICGDVGYGKTEIAVRAAFKAVQDGKQVAVLVPTTLLVQQHLGTFAERYAPFPVKVAALSRFQTDAEAAEVQRQITEGRVDVVIGTHRLIQSGTRWKDLGLVVVDEEQRFGVEHKEYLKHLRTNVDVLSMSATPIPRTLEMAVTGIREMSTIQTPPEERHPVLTFVGSYDEKTISAALRRELLRDGQVFYVHNRVQSIDRAAARIRELVPEARVAVAHGQMNEHLLEQVIIDFWEKRFDVLVCTTIVENGLDIGNANTLICERADLLGLSQLHQLRGRVGRGRERAYAYFLYPEERPLTETAYDRLATIAANSDLGGGMAVAMKDLEIRGAGNLLGGEQSGHIAEVGFDLYLRLVGEAVSEFRGDGPAEVADVRVELPIDAHLPHGYVPGERLRLEAYRRLAEATSDAMVDKVREELVDRYGEPPAPVENLLEVARFRVHARATGITEVTAQGQHIRFGPVELPESGSLRLQRLYPRSIVKSQVRTMLVPRPRSAEIGGQPVVDVELLRWCRQVIDAVVVPVVPVGAEAVASDAAR